MNLKSTKKSVMLFIFLLYITSFSQNYVDAYRLGQQSIDYDARTLAMGNSIMSLGGNFSMTLLNPAGVATMNKTFFNLGFASNGYNNESSFFNTTSTSDRSNTNFNNISLTLPLPTKRGRAVLAFGYNQLKDFNSTLNYDGFNPNNNSMIQDLTMFNDDVAFELGVSYPLFDTNNKYIKDTTLVNGRLNQSGKLIEDGSLNSWVMSGAFEFSKNIYFGVTLNILSGEYSSNRTYIEDDYERNIYKGFLDPLDSNTFNFQSFYLNDIINWNISGWDLRFGLLYNLDNFLSFGASVKLPTYYEVDERYNIMGESEFNNRIAYTLDRSENRINYKLSSPFELTTGISARFPIISLSLSANFVDYSQMKFDKGFTQDKLFSLNEDINNLFENVINWNVGTEIDLPFPNLKLRGGFIYQPSPYKQDASEYDKKYVTTGLGFSLSKNLFLDFAYAYGWWKDFGDNYGVDLSRTFQDISQTKVFVSLTMNLM